MKIFYDWKKVFDIGKTSFSSARNEYNLHEVEKNKNSSTGLIHHLIVKCLLILINSKKFVRI